MAFGEKNLLPYLLISQFLHIALLPAAVERTLALSGSFSLAPNPTTLPEMPQDKMSPDTLGLVLPSAQN